ncbi:MAG: aminomethyl-transferring glycine dehydrogenase subunit GcvPA [Spirochaetales bacterium]|nr:aminomethyl-transferring glycine dehydrogenase subunit GcvPA [Spirochaetales bacterium]
MTYFPHSQQDIKDMLKTIGKNELNDLLTPIAKEFIADKMNLPDGMSEAEVDRYFKRLAARNRPYKSIFMGAGAYNHYIPAAVDEITSRQEFYTAYTPYQAEISQGTLQAIFEYQTYICRLTGMDATNASMYDGATALAESAMMAVAQTRQQKLLVDSNIHPEYLTVLRTYMTPKNVEIDLIDTGAYEFDKAAFDKAWSKDYAAFIVASTNFCGSFIDYSQIVENVHADRRLEIQVFTEIMTFTAMKTPAELGADITCGEAQSLGNPLSYGGPYLGVIACKKEYMRKMPGRIVGQTKDKDGNIAYTLTLTAREQHIRRELASSNICSNHGLCAFRASVYMSMLGKTGMESVGKANIIQSHKLQKKIAALPNFEIVPNQIFFNEFVVKTNIPADKLNKALEDNDILSCYPLENNKGCYIVCCTEMCSDEDIDNFVNVLGGIK